MSSGGVSLFTSEALESLSESFSLSSVVLSSVGWVASYYHSRALCRALCQYEVYRMVYIFSRAAIYIYIYICICFVLGCRVTFPALISDCGRMFDLICIYLSHDDSNGSNEIELP